MYPSERNPEEQRESPTMNTQGASHHGVHPLKEESSGSRTTSPTLVLHPSQDYSGSPLGQSESSISTGQTNSPYPYQYQQHHHYARSPMASSLPTPVRSGSWTSAPETKSPTNSVPSMIMTDAHNGPSLPSFKLSAKPSSSNALSSKTVPAGKRKHTAKKSEKSGGGNKKDEVVSARRQKRLERNRESARLSRRRRKQYLEVLEEKVSQLSLEMDQGRRAHAAAAIETVLAKRREIFNAEPSTREDPNRVLPLLDTSLSRTSQELSVLTTFEMQQLKSFVLPAHSKFILWLTLQGDTYYRGGRAASERLSAARIGERMLHNGNDKVTPVNSMWPLVCNEVGLSYDQEERVRIYQRALLQEPSSWLERHTARASGLAMQSFHDSLNAVGSRLNERECKTSAKVLTPEQRLKFLAWAEFNAGRLREKFHAKRQALGQEKESKGFQTSSAHHVAANLYILNDRLQKVLHQFPPRVKLVNPAQLKKLSRRPSFESLGQQRDENGNLLSREDSFASSSSLKRSISSLSMVSENGEDKPPQQVSPEDGETAAASFVEKELGFVRKLIPPIAQPVLPPAPAPAPVSLPPAPPAYQQTYHVHAAAPSQVSTNHYSDPPAQQPQMIATHHHHQSVHPGSYQAYAPQQYYAAPVSHSQPLYPQTAPGPAGQPMHQPQQIYAQPAPAPIQQKHIVYNAPSSAGPAPLAPAPPPLGADTPHHQRKSSFLPPHLNVVPEEMYPAIGESGEDYLMSLIDGDWAIGEGIDMDTAL